MPQGGWTLRAPEMPLAFHVDACRLWLADEFSPVRIGFSDVAWDVLHPGPGDRAIVVEVEAVIDDSPSVKGIDDFEPELIGRARLNDTSTHVIHVGGEPAPGS